MRTFPQAHIYYTISDLEEFLVSIPNLDPETVLKFLNGLKRNLNYGSLTYVGPNFETSYPQILELILRAGFIKDVDGEIMFRMDC